LLPSTADPQSISIFGVWRADVAGLGTWEPSYQGYEFPESTISSARPIRLEEAASCLDAAPSPLAAGFDRLFPAPGAVCDCVRFGLETGRDLAKIGSLKGDAHETDCSRDRGNTSAGDCRIYQRVMCAVADDNDRAQLNPCAVPNEIVGSFEETAWRIWVAATC